MSTADAADVAEAMTEFAVSLRAAGHSMVKVAKMTGVPRGTVYDRIKRLTRAPKARGRRRAFDAREEVSVRQWAADEGLTKLADFKARIKADFGKDVSLSTIRRALDRSPGSGGNAGDDASPSSRGVESAAELKLKSKKRATIIANVITANAVQLQAEGQSLTEIAKTAGVPRGTLYYRIQRLGRPQKRRGRRPTLDAIEEASARRWAAEQGGRYLDAVKTRIKSEFGKDVSATTLRRILDRASRTSTNTHSDTVISSTSSPHAAVMAPRLTCADAAPVEGQLNVQVSAGI